MSDKENKAPDRIMSQTLLLRGSDGSISDNRRGMANRALFNPIGHDLGHGELAVERVDIAKAAAP